MTNQTKHTPEPWVADSTYIRTRQSTLVIVSAESDMGSIEEDEANARRIVACVNACVGINTAHLENYGLPASAEKISSLAEQRGQLLYALEYALPYLEACVPNPRNGVNHDLTIDLNCVDRAKSAIAAAKGGAV